MRATQTVNKTFNYTLTTGVYRFSGQSVDPELNLSSWSSVVVRIGGHPVAESSDLIAMVRVRDHDAVATTIADKLNKVPGVLETETHIAFRAYSQHDLESAFSLGLD